MNDWLADMLVPYTADRSTVQPIDAPPGVVGEGSGYGRLVELTSPILLTEIIKLFAMGLDRQYFMVARPNHSAREMDLVKSVAVCAGSGYDVLKNTSADVLVTGEVSHHNALKATMEGKCVITVFHSNSERLFLRQRLQPNLAKLLQSEVAGAQVLVSEEDEDPFEIWDVEDMPGTGN